MWWLYPPSSDESTNNEEDEEDGFTGSWIIGCAWIWIAFSIIIIDFLSDEYRGGVEIPLFISLGLFVLLIITCGRGFCYSIHSDVPWAVLIGSTLVLCYQSIKH